MSSSIVYSHDQHGLVINASGQVLEPIVIPTKSPKTPRPAALSRLTSSIHRTMDSPKPQRARPVKLEWNGVKYEAKGTEEPHMIDLYVPLESLDPILIEEARNLFRRWDEDRAGALGDVDASIFLDAVATLYDFPEILVDASTQYLSDILATKKEIASAVQKESPTVLSESRRFASADSGRISPTAPVQLLPVVDEDDEYGELKNVPGSIPTMTESELFEESDAVRLLAPIMAEFRMVSSDYAVMYELTTLEANPREELKPESRRRLTELSRWRDTYMKRWQERDAQFSALCVSAAEERRVRAKLAALIAAPFIEEPLITPIDVTVGNVEPQIEEGVIDSLLAKYNQRAEERERAAKESMERPLALEIRTDDLLSASLLRSPILAPGSPHSVSSQSGSGIYAKTPSSVMKRRSVIDSVHAQFASTGSATSSSSPNLRPQSRNSSGSFSLNT